MVVHFCSWRILSEQCMLTTLAPRGDLIMIVDCKWEFKVSMIFLHTEVTVLYSVKLWRWKSLMKFGKWSMSESLTSKTLMNWVRFLLALIKTNYCGIIMCSQGLRTCKFHICVLELASYDTQHEKIGLMCTKYSPLHYSTYLTFSIRYTSSVNYIKIPHSLLYQ